MTLDTALTLTGALTKAEAQIGRHLDDSADPEISACDSLAGAVRDALNAEAALPEHAGDPRWQRVPALLYEP